MLDQVKSLFLKKNHQFLILDKIGILEESCNSLVNLDSWINSPIYFNIPFFETLRVDIEMMKLGERQEYNCFSFPFNERQGIYDIVVQKEIINDELKFLCIIEDRTDQYDYWLDIQQERNASHINSEIIQKQKKTIEIANHEITDSINYAKRIQSRILPTSETLHRIFNSHFLIYKPKDIVSGDFYWAKECQDKVFFCVADATGHGVPGAIMSVIGNSLFTEAIASNITSTPAEILNYARDGIIKTLKQNFEPGSQFDGMDAAMISIDAENGLLEYSGANNQLLIAKKEQNSISVTNTITKDITHIEPVVNRNGKSLFELTSDKIPIALFNGSNKEFTNKQIKVESGDRIFLFTDGYRDQFGGAKIKKIGYRRFKELILDTSELEVDVQRDNLNIALETWRGRNEQIDDVCVFGFEI